MFKHPTLRTVRTVLPLVFALGALAGCSSSDSGADDSSSATSGEDALTSDEQAAGASWNGVDADDLSVDDEADALATTDDQLPPDSASTAEDVQTASIHPLSGGCTHTTGFNHGSQMSICTVVIDGKAVEQSTANAFMKMHD